MPSELPPGHPGDVVWRLALTRTLSSMKAVGTDQVQRAMASAAKGGLFVTALVEAGANADRVLTAWAIATGAPSAPRYETRNPPLELAGRMDEGLLRVSLAVPFAIEGDQLSLAFAVPLPAHLTALLPPHRAYVGLEDEIRHGLETLFPARKKKHDPPAAAPVGPAVVPVAPPPAPPAGPAPIPLTAVVSTAAPAPPDLAGAGMLSFDGNFSLDSLPAPPGEVASGGMAATDPMALPPMPDFAALAPPPGVPAEWSPGAPTAQAPLPPPPAQFAPPQPPAAPRANVPALPPSSPAYVEDRFADLKGQLRVLRVPAAIVFGLIAAVKVGSCIIDRSRDEVDRRSADLAAGLHGANQEAAKNRAAELRAQGALPPAPPPEAVAQTGVPPVAAPAGPVGTFDSVSGALASADLAARDHPEEFGAKCRVLSEELRAYRTRTVLPALEQAELANATNEVTVACEREGVPSDFGRLRDRVSRALRGEPSPGSSRSRFQLDTPPEVEAVFGAIDVALARQDASGACGKLGAAQNAISDWMPRMPGGPRVARMAEVVGTDLEDLRSVCGSLSSDQVKDRWQRIKQKLEPEH